MDENETTIASTDEHGYLVPTSVLDNIDPYIRQEVQKYLLKNFQELKLPNTPFIKGNFGEVYQGTLYMCDESVKVAVKKLINFKLECPKEIEEFFQEAITMKRASHENVLSLIGVIILENVPLLVTPFMELGNLRDFLRKDFLALSFNDLLRFGLDIACGMECLEVNGVIHRDLACRNCLLNGERRIKVADFGLARVRIASSYYMHKESPLPVAWMAPETLQMEISKRKFSHKSDVWSFSITLWETFSGGNPPFAYLGFLDIKRIIDSGERLPKPNAATEQVYNLMQDCWAGNACQRPTFSEIVQRMNEMVTCCTDGETNEEQSTESDFHNTEPDGSLVSKYFEVKDSEIYGTQSDAYTEVTGIQAKQGLCRNWSRIRLVVAFVTVLLFTIVLTRYVFEINMNKANLQNESGDFISQNKQAYIMIIGGYKQRDTRTDFNETYLYKVSQGKVTFEGPLGPLPNRWIFMGRAMAGRYCYIAGGGYYLGNSTWSRVESAVYSIDNNTWNSLPDTNIMRPDRPLLFVLGDFLYVLGGYRYKITNTMESLDLDHIQDGWKINNFSLPDNATDNIRFIHTRGVALNGRVYICLEDSLVSWTPGETKWTKVLHLKYKRPEGVCVVTNGIDSLFIVAGCASMACWKQGFVQKYNVQNNVVTSMYGIPGIMGKTEIIDCTVAEYWQGYIYTLLRQEGRITDYVFHIYNIKTDRWSISETKLFEISKNTHVAVHVHTVALITYNISDTLNVDRGVQEDVVSSTGLDLNEEQPPYKNISGSNTTMY